MIEVSTTEGVRTAAELRPDGCWSRELFVIRGDQLSRGHQRLCGDGPVRDACEAWVTVQTTFQGGLKVPYGAEGLSQSHSRVWTEKRVGEVTQETRTEHDELCAVRLDPATFQVTLEKRDETPVLVLSDLKTGLIWRLVTTKPDAAPFKEVAP